jgi:hypothetical protein
VIRKVFGYKGDELTGQWWKLHRRELRNLYSSPDIVRQIKSGRMRRLGHVARIGEERHLYRFWLESPRETAHLEAQGLGGRMGSIWTLGRFWWEGGLQWIPLAQDGDCWRTVVNAVMNFRFLAPRGKLVS